MPGPWSRTSSHHLVAAPAQLELDRLAEAVLQRVRDQVGSPPARGAAGPTCRPGRPRCAATARSARAPPPAPGSRQRSPHASPRSNRSQFSANRPVAIARDVQQRIDQARQAAAALARRAPSLVATFWSDGSPSASGSAIELHLQDRERRLQLVRRQRHELVAQRGSPPRPGPARSCSSCRRRRSVRSRVTLVKPTSSPFASRSAVITTLAQNREPSLRTRQPSSSKRPSRAAISSSRSHLPVARRPPPW